MLRDIQQSYLFSRKIDLGSKTMAVLVNPRQTHQMLSKMVLDEQEVYHYSDYQIWQAPNVDDNDELRMPTPPCSSNIFLPQPPAVHSL